MTITIPLLLIQLTNKNYFNFTKFVTRDSSRLIVSSFDTSIFIDKEGRGPNRIGKLWSRKVDGTVVPITNGLGLIQEVQLVMPGSSTESIIHSCQDISLGKLVGDIVIARSRDLDFMRLNSSGHEIGSTCLGKRRIIEFGRGSVCFENIIHSFPSSRINIVFLAL